MVRSYSYMKKKKKKTHMTCIFLARCSSKATSIVKDPTHPSHSLFQLLPSGRLYRSIRACSARLLNSFFPRLWEPSIPITSPHSETSSTTLAPETQDPPPIPPHHTTPHYMHHMKTVENLKNIVQFWVCYTQVSGLDKPPVETQNWVEKYRHIGYRQKSNIVHP